MAKGNPAPSPETRFGGERGNVPGRKYTKDKLSQAFLKDLQEVWEAKGRDCLERLAGEGDLKANAAIAKIVASLEPKEVEPSDPLRQMTDDKLIQAIGVLTEALREKTPPAEPENPQHTVN